MAAAAPPAVLTGLYFTYLRVQKRVGHLILLSGLVAAATLGAAVALMPRFGIAANGMGWLTGNALVAVIAIGSVWKDAAKNRKEI
jgi:O-antigen/teichoic acid export membrane protein